MCVTMQSYITLHKYIALYKAFNLIGRSADRLTNIALTVHVLIIQQITYDRG